MSLSPLPPLPPIPQAKAVGGAAGFGSSVPRSPGADGRMAERHRETPELCRADGNPDSQDHPADRQAQGTAWPHCYGVPPLTKRSQRSICMCVSELEIESRPILALDSVIQIIKRSPTTQGRLRAVDKLDKVLVKHETLFSQ